MKNMEKIATDKRKEIICELMEDDQYVPMKEKELAMLLQVSREDRQELRRLLEELLAEGRLTVNAQGKYRKADGQTLIGTYISHAKGFGFVEIEGSQEDLFVPPEMTGGALHRDTVQVVLIRGDSPGGGQHPKAAGGGQASRNGHRKEARVLRILKRGITQVVGTVTEADRAGRRDLRDQLLITIDGEDAKDLDDAVSVTFDGQNYRLGVHIADVTNYVQEGSALDREALRRGTSVYLVDRVIPMLPHALSNGICSLNAGVDRLALSCLMTIDTKGSVIDYEICESVIRVRHRMSYTGVKRLLTEDNLTKEDPAFSEYAKLLPMLKEMETLSGLLRKKRRERGGIDFDFPECKILLDQRGVPQEIRPYERNVATRLIEDFMLAANETVAQHFYWQELPFVYRVHEAPDQDKIQKLAAFLYNFGYYMKNIGQMGGRAAGEREAARRGRGAAAGRTAGKRGAGHGQAANVHPKEIQKLLQKVERTPEEAMISRLTLRSMKQAKYSTESSGHFGLACQYYCHFTSPIRRYPDLQIHRIIKEQLRGRLNEDRIRHYRDILPEVAKESSRLERRADEAERETDKLKKVQYMEERIGEVYEGVVSGITAWGIYVELSNTVEGLVHVSRLPGDYYCYHEDTYEMVGETTGRAFSLGQPVTVQVAGTDRLLRTVDFDLAE